MKLVKEYINEKFTADSDPISDMGIGIREAWNNLKEGDIFKLVKTLKIEGSGNVYLEGSYFYVEYASDIDIEGKKYFDIIHYKNKRDLLNKQYPSSVRSWRMSFNWWKKYFNIVSIDKIINEKFIEDSDPISDMGIGIDKKRNFENEIERSEWIVKYLSHILNMNKIPEDIIRSTSYYINNIYADKIEKYAQKYLLLNGSYEEPDWEYLHRSLSKRGFKVKETKKIVNEKFAEESDPIKDMKIGKEGIFNDLEKKGVTMWFSWEDGEIQKKRAIENIYEIKKTIDKLIKAGFKYNEIELSSSRRIRVTGIDVLKGNRVIFSCISEEDAQNIINVAKKFSVWDFDDFKTQESSFPVSIHIKDHVWLDELIENREKYKNIK
jgi:hypothetical protein